MINIRCTLSLCFSLGDSGRDGAVGDQHQAVHGLFTGPVLRRDQDVSGCGSLSQRGRQSQARGRDEALSGGKGEDRGQEQFLQQLQ